MFCVCALPTIDSVNILPKIFYFATVHIRLLPKMVIFNMHQIPLHVVGGLPVFQQ